MNDLFSREVLADYHTKLECLVRQMRMKNYTIKAEDEIRKMWKGHQMIAVLNGRCVMGRMALMNVKPSMTWQMRREASPCPSRNYAMVAVKSSHQNTQQGIVQEEETVRFKWQSIQLVYMDTRSEERMTVKVMMIQERLSKVIVPTSKAFSVNQLELEKFLACGQCLSRSNTRILKKS